MRKFSSTLSSLVFSLTTAALLSGCKDSFTPSPPAPAPVHAQAAAAAVDSSLTSTSAQDSDDSEQDEATSPSVAEDNDEAQTIVDAINDQLQDEGLDYEIWTESQPPVIVELRHLHNYGVSDYQVTIRSRADLVQIRDFTLNRGNCGHSHTQKVNVPLEMPFNLRFGDARRARILCSQVIEMDVLTNYGSFTFTF